MRAVMNKDVLCVELVVNHWERWQLTDRQIDPRPSRERRLAPAHSSQPHEGARTRRAHKVGQKTTEPQIIFWAERKRETVAKTFAAHL